MFKIDCVTAWLTAETLFQGISKFVPHDTLIITINIRLMEKILHHLRCLKRSWYGYKKYISGILSGAGYFPSTVLDFPKGPGKISWPITASCNHTMFIVGFSSYHDFPPPQIRGYIAKFQLSLAPRYPGPWTPNWRYKCGLVFKLPNLFQSLLTYCFDALKKLF